MGSFTNKIEPRIRGLIMGNTQWTAKPTTFYLALGTVVPDEDGVWTELSGNGYARQAIVCNNTNWSVVGNVASNAIALNFTAQATAPWEGVNSWALYTAASKGDMIIFGTLASKTVEKWGSPTFGAGDVAVRLGGSYGTFLANKVLKYLFHAAAWTNIPQHYLGFGSAADGDKLDGEPVAVNGAAATGYARTAYANTTARYPVSSSSNSAATNGQPVSGIPTATQEWGYLPVGALLDGPIFSGATFRASSVAFGAATSAVFSDSGAYSRSGNVISITWTNHGLAVGDKRYFSFTTGGATSGVYAVATVVSANIITVIDTVSGTIGLSSVAVYAVGRKIGVTYASGLPSWLATTNPQTGLPQHVDVWFQSATVATPVSRRYLVTAVSGNQFEVEAAADEEPWYTPNALACAFSVANVLGFGTLAAAMTINAPDTPAVPQGAITAAVD